MREAVIDSIVWAGALATGMLVGGITVFHITVDVMEDKYEECLQKTTTTPPLNQNQQNNGDTDA